MDCAEARRRLDVEPAARDEAVRDHVRGCPPCAARAEAVDRLDARIRDALAVPVPEGLADRILLRRSYDDERLESESRRRFLPLAASFVLGVAVPVGWNASRREPSLPEQIVAHVVSDRPFVLRAEKPLSADAIDRVYRLVGAELGGDLGSVTFANLCPIAGRKTAHVALRGALGPVDVILIPGVGVESAMALESNGDAGVLLPFGGGALALLGTRGERLERFEDRVRAAVRWRSPA